MTKRKISFICLGCKAEFPRSEPKSYYCCNECRFYSRVDKTDSCWNWTAGGHKFGYGEFRIGKVFYRAHRYSFEINKGRIPEGFGINHTCDNPLCVNPDHLYAGTQKQNMQDAAIRDRVGSRKLSKDDVLGIKSLLAIGETQTSIALKYGVSQCSIWNIKENKTWKTVNL